MDSSLKTCFACKAKLPLGEFYAHPMMGDGHLGKCKSCCKKYARDRRRDPEAGERIREYDRNRFHHDERRRAVHDERSRTYRFRHPEKYQARVIMHNAARDGKIDRRPCMVCGSKKSEAHHPDYSKPLDVIWLCKKHHVDIHYYPETLPDSVKRLIPC